MYYEINDASYYYEKAGKGKETAVFLHGFTGSVNTWSGFVDCFGEDLTMITIDLPGHGKTNVETPRTMERFCSDLATMLTDLQLEKIHLIGYSMGGRTALSFAVLYPHLVKSLVLESSSPGLEDSAVRLERRKNDEELAAKIERDGTAAFVDFWESIPLFDTQKTLPDYVQRQIRKERLSHTKNGLAQSLKYMGTGVQPSWWEKLGDINLPVCLIAGELDRKFVKINQSMLERLQHAKLVVAEKSGHAIHVERPGFFGKIVSEFIHTQCD